MARKSNKTAHVLNLLATGHDSNKENTDEAEVVETTATSEAADNKEESTVPVANTTPEVTESPAPSPSQSVSVIDTTEADPVADLIHQKLLEELNMDTEAVQIPEPEPAAEPVPEAIQIPEPEPVAEPEPEPIQIPEPEPVAEPEPEPMEIPAPEPDFVVVNVMERIVRDKVIYFMRQFEVCTCDRCIADTVAIALNGLAPKYMVTSPLAAEPLISFYTNRYISDITVEITKACMVVKENPRH